MISAQLQYVSPSTEEFEDLVERLKVQLVDGQGEVIYEIGVGSKSCRDYITISTSLSVLYHRHSSYFSLTRWLL